MKTNEGLSLNQDNLNRLNSELKNKIAQKEKEIQSVKNLYDKKLEDQNQIGEEAYQNHLEHNNQKILNANLNMENKLKDYKDNIEKTKINLAIESNGLKENQNSQIENLKEQFVNNFQNIYSNGEINEADIQFKTQSKIKNLDSSAKFDIIKLENQTNAEYNALSVGFNNKTNLNEKEFRDKISADIKTHQEDLVQQKTQFIENINETTEKNKRLETAKLKVQTDELEYLDKYHKNLMDQKTADFKIRYATQSKEYEKTLNDIKLKLESDLRNTRINTETKMKSIHDKSEDSFYRIEKLEPKLVEVDKSYHLSLNVPEHEKDNVHVVAQSRELKITLNKKFSDELIDDTGAVNRTSKTQLYSKEFKTPDLLNSKHITQNYENGVLTFKIEKL